MGSGDSDRRAVEGRMRLDNPPGEGDIVILTRACTGFDGGSEVGEAIRGPDRVKTGTSKFN